ncbi:lantibiotic dehydratase [Streptomyces sp. NPDC018321]|uniref:lantibiotic dehydratase n=1 Tax=unclassified Streptomyces TaxID=2593676 RepID=UPI00379EE394
MRSAPAAPSVADGLRALTSGEGATALGRTRTPKGGDLCTAPGGPSTLGGDSRQRLLDEVRRLDVPGTDSDAHARQPLHVDLRIPCEFVVPEAADREVCRYATVVWAIIPEWTMPAYLRDYRERFVESYGTACAVTLGELVDPHRAPQVRHGHHVHTRRPRRRGGRPQESDHLAMMAHPAPVNVAEARPLAVSH